MNVIELRRERKLSQDTLALEAGLHRTFVAHVERCARNISLDNVEKLARALDVPVIRLPRQLSRALERARQCELRVVAAEGRAYAEHVADIKEEHWSPRQSRIRVWIVVCHLGR